MENTNIDKVMKNMLADSQLELSHPDFNRMMMKKILLERQRKVKRQMLIYSLFLGVIIEGLAFLIIWALQPNIFNLGSRLNTFVHEMLINVEKAGGWFIENEYFILPLIVIVIFKKIIEASLKYL